MFPFPVFFHIPHLWSFLITITFINCDGGGFASLLDIGDNTSVGELFDKQLPGRRPEDYLIRVDRLPATRDQALTPGCRVSITPTKIAGADVPMAA